MIVVLAGGTGGAKLARGMLDVVEDPAHLAVIANTGDDIEIYGAHVSPDPDLVSFWLADLIDERGWGLQRRHVRGDGRAARARPRGVVQPRRPRPRVVPGAGAAARAGRPAADGGARAPERGDRRARAGAADERRPRAHLDPHDHRLAPLPGVHDPPARRGHRRGPRVPRRRAGDAQRRGARGDRGRPRDRDRPLQPARLDRPDPRRPRHPRGAARRAARRSWPSARSSAARS